MTPGALFCCYGPFNYGGRFTNASNAQFDAAPKQDDPLLPPTSQRNAALGNDACRHAGSPARR